MVDETLPTALFAEAEDENTPAARLEELVWYDQLQLLIAANPATPDYLLTRLSEAKDPTIRCMVAQNPNTPVLLLCKLAAEFPEAFLRNPIIPILNMTQPNFIKGLPFTAWASLLRFADLPLAWFQQIQDDSAYQRNQASTWKIMQLHVSQAHASSNDLLASRDVKGAYQKELPKPAMLPPEEEVELFLRFVLLFPYTAPMLREQWVKAARTSPHKAGIALSLVKEVTPKTLGKVVGTANAFVLNQVARHPAISPRVLQRLTRYPRRRWSSTVVLKMQQALASNPHTDLEALYQLMSAKEAVLRGAVAPHPSLETLDREILALDPEATVRAALALSPRLATNLCAQLAHDPAPGVRAALARNLKTPLELLRILARDPEASVRVAAAGNPRLPVEVQAALLADSAISVRASLSGNARLSLDHAALLARDPAPQVRAYLAANPRTPASLFAELLRTEEPEVRAALARHPRLSPELLAQLARQGDQRARIAVAAHARTPLETLAQLAQENTHEIWCALASNPHAPLNVLELALHTSSVELLYRLINHPAMRREKHRPLLKLLAAQIGPLIAGDRLPNWLRRVFLQYSTALPLEIISLFAVSPHWQERYLVARHPHLPEPVLTLLAQDGICHVQAAAREMLERRPNAR